MANKRERICTFPGCRNLTTTGRCAAHTKTTRYHTDASAKDAKRFLNSAAWLKLRALKLAMTPWCEECERRGMPISKPGTQIDHVLPRSTHPHLALAQNNLQTLCDECHAEKTRKGL